MDLNELKIDPEFEGKIPPLTEEEFNLLEQNILADGQVLVPLIVWKDTILDGHNRYWILKKHPEIPFKTIQKEFVDKYAAIAWICRNQLGRRNLSPEQKRYLIGKQYEAEKLCRGGLQNRNRDKDTGRFTTTPQNEALWDGKNTRTSAKIAEENNTSRAFVERAEYYAKGIDAADEVIPGIRKEILSGNIRPPLAAIREIARAEPEERKELAAKLRLPRIKPDKSTPQEDNHPLVNEKQDEFNDSDIEKTGSMENVPPVRIPKKREILALAESMNHSEGQAIGTVEDMIYEMNSAMQDMIFRWNFCREAYTDPIRSRDGKRQIKELAAQGIEYLKEVRKGVLWKK